MSVSTLLITVIHRHSFWIAVCHKENLQCYLSFQAAVELNKNEGWITAWTDVAHWRRRRMWDYGICGLSVKRQNHSFTAEQRLQIILTTVSFVYSNYFTAAPLMWQGCIDRRGRGSEQNAALVLLLVSALSPVPWDEDCSLFVALPLISPSSLHHLFCLHVSVDAKTPAAALFLTPEFYYSSSPSLWGLGLKCSVVSFIAFPCALPLFLFRILSFPSVW